jgi:hypothetical protein
MACVCLRVCGCGCFAHIAHCLPSPRPCRSLHHSMPQRILRCHAPHHALSHSLLMIAPFTPHLLVAACVALPCALPGSGRIFQLPQATYCGPRNWRCPGQLLPLLHPCGAPRDKSAHRGRSSCHRHRRHRCPNGTTRSDTSTSAAAAAAAGQWWQWR